VLFSFKKHAAKKQNTNEKKQTTNEKKQKHMAHKLKTWLLN